jgi:predicted  nucleic acid-binding Zn-ribbon protein
MGDATKSRIADLASGWSVGDEPAPTPSKPEPTPIPELTPDPEPEPAPRAKRKTQPPPPPGSAERKKLEDAILDAVPNATAAPKSEPVRGKPGTSPPPIPKLPPGKGTAPFGAKAGPTETGTVSLVGAIGTVTAPLPSVPPPPPRSKTETKATTPPPVRHPKPEERALADLFGAESQAVPRGEFEMPGGTEVEQDKRRIAYEQSTLKRDAANALLHIAEQPETMVKPQPVEVLLSETAEVLRGDPTMLDAPSTTKFERGDPTSLGDPTIAQVNAAAVNAGTLRAQAALRRKRGIGGDVRYVLTVVFGVRKARVELTTLEARQELRQQSRRRHLVTLGRAAATLDGFDHPALGPAREAIAGIEDERGRHAGAVAEADSELMRVRRDRDAKSEQHAKELAALDKELIDIDKRLEPLLKEVASVAKRAEELKSSLRKLDNKIANTEMSQHSVAGGRERAGIQAEIATLKADRIAVQRDEPKLAGELDALNPRIAALEANRADAKKRKTEIEKAEIDDQRRSEELLAAIGAKRKVVDRAASDAETLRDKIMFELGERLYHDRPLDLGPQLAPIDVIDVELGTGDRRTMELKEIISSVDKAKLARGIGVILLAGAAITFGVLLALGAF